jgi:hypothetical protein
MGTCTAELVRDITNDEVSFFEDHGWVKLDRIIPPAKAAKLLQLSRGILEKADVTGTSKEPRWTDSYWYRNSLKYFSEIGAIHLPEFLALHQSKEMGRLAHRLLNRERLTDNPTAVRYLAGSVFCKMGDTSAGGEETPYHQDATQFLMDRAGLVTVWIALDEVRPEQGSMRFLDGSHREGPLGSNAPPWPLSLYPKLADRYALSPQLHYRPGDATAHHGWTLHGAPANLTPQPRWGYALLYMADDVKFSDAHRVPREGLLPPLERFPIVYP